MTLRVKRFLAECVWRGAVATGLMRWAEWRHRHVPLALCYHGVTDRQRPGDLPSLHVTCDEFGAQLAYLTKRYRVVPIVEFVRAVQDGTAWGARLATVTFDDGYENWASEALPLLKRHGVEASFFVTTDALDAGGSLNVELRAEMKTLYGPWETLSLEAGEIRWNFRRSDYPNAVQAWRNIQSRLWRVGDRPTRFALYRAIDEQLPSTTVPEEDCGRFTPLTWEGAERLVREGMYVGSHGATHRPMQAEPQDELLHQLTRSREVIVKRLGVAPDEVVLAYPYGDVGRTVWGAARQAGFLAALEVGSIFEPFPWDPYAIPRLGVGRGTSMPALRAGIGGLWRVLRRMKVWAGRWRRGGGSATVAAAPACGDENPRPSSRAPGGAP